MILLLYVDEYHFKVFAALTHNFEVDLNYFLLRFKAILRKSA